ncbi:hypothetical protein NYA28ABAC_00031 [Salinicola sp. NYA28a]|jgi:hypothetical protein
MWLDLYWRKKARRLLEAYRRLKRSDRQEAIRQFEKRFGHPPDLSQYLE